MKEKTRNSGNYVRIVYLKEMKPSKKLETEDTSFTKNSLAYLSSLIQEDNKKRMDNTPLPPSLELTSEPAIHAETKTGYSIGRRQSESFESKRVTLNKIISTMQASRGLSIKLEKPHSRSLKLPYEGEGFKQS